MDGVSTFGLYSLISQNATRVQTALAEKEVQEASGLVGQTYGDLGTTAATVLDLNAEAAQTESWTENAITASNRVQAMYSAVGNMISLVTSLRSTISEAMSSNDESTVVSQAQGTLSDLASLMNTQLGGLYLFGGSSTTTAPVDVSNPPYGAPVSDTTVDTSYYQGDDVSASVQISAEESITYGVTADEPGFEEALRAANIVANLSSGSSSAATTLQDAYDVATSAISALANVQSTLSTTASRLQDAEQENSIYLSFVQNLSDNVESVDTAAVATQVSTYETQLEAAYSAIAAINKVNLTDYL